LAQPPVHGGQSFALRPLRQYAGSFGGGDSTDVSHFIPAVGDVAYFPMVALIKSSKIRVRAASLSWPTALSNRQIFRRRE
jgi:hypothetical protein